MKNALRNDPVNDFLRRFPKSRQVPSVHGIQKQPAKNAKRLLVNIRQIHDAPDITQEELHQIRIVQKDIKSILRFLIRDERTKLDHVYAEGLPFDSHTLGSVHFNPRLPGSTMRDLFREIDIHDELSSIARSSLIRDYISYFLNERKISMKYKDRIKLRSEKSIDEYIENLRTEMWSGGDKEHKKINETFIKQIRHFRWFVENIVFRLTPVRSWEDVYKAGDNALVRLEQIRSGKGSPRKLECSILERLERKWNETQDTYQKNAAQMVSYLQSIASHDMHAVYELYSNRELSLRGSESSFIAFAPTKIKTEETILAVRDQIQLALVAKMPDKISYSVRGCAHDMCGAAREWNRHNPDEEISVIEITPKSLVQFIGESSDDSE